MVDITRFPISASDFNSWFPTSFYGPGAINGSYGAIGNNVADDTAAIQLAIDTQIYGQAGAVGLNGPVVLHANVFRTTDTLHVGYGTGYSAGRLRGSGPAFQGNESFGTGIVPDFSNRPCINVQGGRMAEISDIGMFGKLAVWIEGHALYLPGPNVADFIDPALHANANSRYAPYAGVAIDAYRGALPSPAYPNVTYPSFLGVVAQYDKAASSNVLISRAHIRGFVVGVVIQPNGDGNGDFVRLRDVLITSCVYAFSVGNTQARNSACDNVFAGQIHTFVTAHTHGVQNGRLGPFTNCHAGLCVQIFDFGGLSIAGPIVFTNLYTELLYRIGSLTAGASTEQSLTFDGCLFNFDLQLLAGNSKFGVPATLVSSTAGVLVPIIFQGGSFISFNGAAVIHLPYSGITIDGVCVIPVERTLTYQKFAHNALCGGLAFLNLGYDSAPGYVNAKFTNFNLDTGDSFQTVSSRSPYPSKRIICTPLWVREHVGYLEKDGEGVHIPGRVDRFDMSSFASVTRSGRTLTFTFSSRTEAEFMNQGPLPGDVMMIEPSGSVLFVTARTALVVTAVLQTNYNQDSTLITPMDLAADVLFVGNSRCYSPAYAIYGDFTAGSATIANVQRADGSSGDIETQIAVGDYLFIDPLHDATVTQANAKVLARDNTARTITLAGNADLSATRKRLGSFVRLPPPNA